MNDGDEEVVVGVYIDIDLVNHWNRIVNILKLLRCNKISILKFFHFSDSFDNGN